MLQQEISQAKEAIREAIAQLGLPQPENIDLRQIPFSGQWGLATSVCHQLARNEVQVDIPEGLSKKEARKLLEAASREKAQSLAESIANYLSRKGIFADVQAQNGYVNMFFEPSDVALRLLATVHEQGDSYGRGNPKSETVMVEYGQPNTHKQFHIGHLRNTALGDSIARILDFAGYRKVLKASYIGDIGAHVIKWLWGYNKWHSGEQPPADPYKIGPWLESIYVEANSAIESNPDYQREYRDLFARWDRRDPEVVELWRRTREWSLNYFRRIFKELDVNFDVWFYESDFEEPGKKIVQDLLNKGVAEIDEGAPIVRIDQKLGLEKETYRTIVLQRSDGTSLYQTKELALTRTKFDEYKVDRILNVVDVRQTLYFQQVFKVLELLGYEQARNSQHIPYELVSLPTGPMSSREGTTVGYDEFATEMYERALEVVREKNPEMPQEQQERIARIVSMGSMKFGMLNRDNTRVLVFDKEEALDFDGFSAPYVQYAHARACRILEKAPGIDWENLRVGDLSTVETNLLEMISRLNESVERAAREYKPLHVVNYVYELAKTFNEFYRVSPVLRAEEEVRNFRLALVYATKVCLANSLYLLGIEAPEVM